MMDEELEQAELRVQAALRALDAAKAELDAARKVLLEADRRKTRADLEREMKMGHNPEAPCT